MTGLFLMFFATLAGVMGGVFFSNKTRAREIYFEEMLGLTERLISDISFLQCKVEKILESCQFKSLHLNKNIIEYLRFTAGGEFVFSAGVLSKREVALVKDFFDRLGILDLNTQINELEARREVFRGLHVSAAARNKNYGKAYIKLGFLAGLLIGILLL